MAQVNPKTPPIALIAGGLSLIGLTVYSTLAFGRNVDGKTLDVIFAVSILIGLFAIGLGAYLYDRERERHYRWSLNP